MYRPEERQADPKIHVLLVMKDQTTVVSHDGGTAGSASVPVGTCPGCGGRNIGM